MKILIGFFCLSLTYSAYADTYDPATNMLTIPTITVDGVTYVDVVVTVREILSIGDSFVVPIDQVDDRKCNWSFVTDNPYHNIEYELIIRPSSKTISVAMIGLSDFSSFYPFSVNLVQDTNSSEVTFIANNPGVLWVGDDGFSSGNIPLGVKKTGTLSRFPSWFDFSREFAWLSDGERHSC